MSEDLNEQLAYGIDKTLQRNLRLFPFLSLDSIQMGQHVKDRIGREQRSGVINRIILWNSVLYYFRE